MTENERIIDAFRNCITEPKCKDCPWDECDTLENGRVEIPRDLALAVMRTLADSRLRPRKPWHTKVQYAGGEEWITDQCPECQGHVELGIWDTLIDRNTPYCRRCGQAIDWSEYDGRDQIDWDEYMSHVGERVRERYGTRAANPPELSPRG